MSTLSSLFGRTLADSLAAEGPINQLGASWSMCVGLDAQVILTRETATGWADRELAKHGHPDTDPGCRRCRDIQDACVKATSLGILVVYPSR